MSLENEYILFWIILIRFSSPHEIEGIQFCFNIGYVLNKKRNRIEFGNLNTIQCNLFYLVVTCYSWKWLILLWNWKPNCGWLKITFTTLILHGGLKMTYTTWKSENPLRLIVTI